MPPLTETQRLFGLSGTMGADTFVRASRGGRNQAYRRQQRRSDKEAFRTRPSLAPTRAWASDFGCAATLGKELRHALADLVPHFPRPVCGALVGRLQRLVAADRGRPLGQHRLLVRHLPGLVDFRLRPEGVPPAGFGRGIRVSQVPSGALTLTVPALPPQSALPPPGATHYGYQVAVLLFHEGTGTFHRLPPLPSHLTTFSCPTTLASPSSLPSLLLTFPLSPKQLPPGPVAAVVVLGLVHYEAIDGTLVRIKSEASPLVVAHVAELPPLPPPPLPRPAGTRVAAGPRFGPRLRLRRDGAFRARVLRAGASRGGPPGQPQPLGCIQAAPRNTPPTLP